MIKLLLISESRYRSLAVGLSRPGPFALISFTLPQPNRKRRRLLISSKSYGDPGSCTLVNMKYITVLMWGRGRGGLVFTLSQRKPVVVEDGGVSRNGSNLSRVTDEVTTGHMAQTHVCDTPGPAHGTPAGT